MWHQPPGTGVCITFKSTLMRGRFRVVILHETTHELKREKQNGIILKLDFKKAYDKVNWEFLQQALRMKGFSQKWCKWIENIVTGGSVGVQINDEIGHFFQTKKV